MTRVSLFLIYSVVIGLVFQFLMHCSFQLLATFGRFDANKQSGIKLTAVRDNISSVCILFNILFGYLQLDHSERRIDK